MRLLNLSSPRGIVILLTFLAFLARVYNLPFESLDIDETDGVVLASADFFTLAARLVQPGENGPLYFILLRLWMALTGQGEFALRFLALVPGVLFIPATFVLGKRLFGAQVGLISSLMAAFSSYLLYYSQMNKMYSLLVLLSVVSSYLFLMVLSHGGRRLWALYWALASATMYTHVFGVLIIPWHGLFFLLQVKKYRDKLTGWLLTTALLSLPYLPLGAWHLSALGSPGQLNRQFSGPHDLLGMLAVTAGEFGTRYQVGPIYLLGTAFVILGGLGLGVTLVREGPVGWRSGALFLLLGDTIPLLTTYFLVVLGAPLFSSRYLMVSLPAFLLSWTLGIVVLKDRRMVLAGVVLALVLALNLAWWSQTGLAGRGVREDWRSAVRYMDERYQEGDSVLLLHSNTLNPIKHYGNGDFSFVNLDLDGGGTNGPLDERLSRATTGKHSVWFLTPYYEMGDFPTVEPWLNANAYLVDMKWFRGIKALRYVPASQGLVEAKPQVSVKANFGNKLELMGYDLFFSQENGNTPWLMRFYWQAREPMDVEYWTSVRLLDASNRIWGRSDGPIGGGFYPSQTWRVRQVVPDDREITLVTGTPPATYRLVVLVYKRETLENLLLIPLDESSPYERLVGTVELAEPVSVGNPNGRLFGATFGGWMELAAAALEPTTAKPGEKMYLTAYWRAEKPVEEGFSAKVQLIGAEDRIESEVSSAFGTEAYPVGVWEKGRIVAQKFELLVPHRLLSGVYRVRLRMVNREGNAVSVKESLFAIPKDYLDIGATKVIGREKRFAAPMVSKPPMGYLGDIATLLDYKFEVNDAKKELPITVKGGDTIKMTLVWKAVGETEASYQVFVHLLDSKSQVRGQHDGVPMLGNAPTYSWMKGEVIEDTHTFGVAKDAPSGEYKIEVGLYDLKTGRRLKTPEGQDRILLAPLQVNPP